MIFNSVLFIAFLVMVIVGYFILPYKIRWIFLLLMSLWFYMAWNPKFIILMFVAVFSNYICSRFISKTENKNNRKLFLTVALVINFGNLFIFKYAMFFNETFRVIFKNFGFQYPISPLDIILPMGISFFTFQAVSYTIDVYRKQTEPIENFFKLFLFITYFPQLVAGPIERTDSLYPQLFKEYDFKFDNFIMGLKFIAFGFFKKVVIADRIAVLVNTIYNSPTYYEGLYFIIATIFFAFQIYCDFSGYSDIAKGCSKILGIELMDNFKTPYMARGIKEFWSRWHISLSTWFKDYVYIPLGGNRVSTPRKYYNLMVTFLASGLWHGADWTYVIWGGLHGILQIIDDVVSKPINKYLKLIKLDKFFVVNIFSTLITFLIVCFTWIFFRANNFSDSIYIIKNLFSGIENWSDKNYVYNVLNDLGIPIFEFFISLLCILFLVVVEVLSRKENIHYFLNRKPLGVQFIFYYIVTLLVFVLGVFYNASAFIYFQF